MDFWATSLLIFAVCTIGFTGFFLGTMPSELVNPIQNPNLKYQSYQENWILGSPSEIYHMNQTVNLMAPWDYVSFNFATATPSISVEFRMFFHDAIYGRSLRLEWVTWYLWWMVNTEIMIWKDSIFSTYIQKADILSHVIVGNVSVSYFEKVYSTNPSVHVQFIDPNQTRNNLGNAWDEGSLNTRISFGTDNVTIAMNALTLVAELLFFQAWNWCDPIIMFVIDLPFWTLTAYIGARIIRLFIPFLSGN